MSRLLCERCPELQSEWNKEENDRIGLDWYSLTVGSDKKAHWICPKQTECGCVHKYEQRIKSKTGGQGCPYCSGISNSKKFCYHETLEWCYPEFAKEWHPTKNGTLSPKDITPYSHKVIWWVCSNTCKYGCLHEWQTRCDYRTAKGDETGCPYCYGNHKLCYHQSLAHLYPELSKEWHPIKNGLLKPSDFTPGSHKKVWWQCPKNPNHEHYSVIKSRSISNRKCPYCINKTEDKLFEILGIEIPTLQRQFRADWCRNPETGRYFPFDFLVPEYKAIIELDGIQHFKQVSKWKSPEKIRKNDQYKMDCAIQEGYSIIRLRQEDVYYDTFDWVQRILDTLQQIGYSSEPQIVPLVQEDDDSYEWIRDQSVSSEENDSSV